MKQLWDIPWIDSVGRRLKRQTKIHKAQFMNRHRNVMTSQRDFRKDNPFDITGLTRVVIH